MSEHEQHISVPVNELTWWLDEVRTIGLGERYDPSWMRPKKLSRDERLKLTEELLARISYWLQHGRISFNGTREAEELDELAEQQDITPMTNVRKLFGTWPGDADDGFESDVDELRHGKREADAATDKESL